jgi:hypothetical protein
MLLIGCALVFGCGSSDKNAAVTAGETTGSSATNSWGVPSSATSSWGVPSDGANSWGAPSSGMSSWGVPTGGGTAAGGAGGGGGASFVCNNEPAAAPTVKCPVINLCVNQATSVAYYEAGGQRFTFILTNEQSRTAAIDAGTQYCGN